MDDTLSKCLAIGVVSLLLGVALGTALNHHKKIVTVTVTKVKPADFPPPFANWGKQREPWRVPPNWQPQRFGLVSTKTVAKVKRAWRGPPNGRGYARGVDTIWV